MSLLTEKINIGIFTVPLYSVNYMTFYIIYSDWTVRRSTPDRDMIFVFSKSALGPPRSYSVGTGHKAAGT